MFTLPNVKPETIAALITKLKADPENSVQQSGNEFIISGQGVVGQASYSPASQSLTVSVTKKPWYVPESMVESKLRQQIEEVQA